MVLSPCDKASRNFLQSLFACVSCDKKIMNNFCISPRHSTQLRRVRAILLGEEPSVTKMNVLVFKVSQRLFNVSAYSETTNIQRMEFSLTLNKFSGNE